MSKQISTVFNDTVIAGVTKPVLTIPVLNYDADFRLKSTTANEVSMVNTTTSLDEDETIRLSVSEINDIYKNTGISADIISNTRQGYSLLVQVVRTVKVTDPNNSAFSSYLPLSAHMVIKIPKAEGVTNDVVQDLITRTIGAFYDNGAIKALAMLKGAISPKGL